MAARYARLIAEDRATENDFDRKLQELLDWVEDDPDGILQLRSYRREQDKVEKHN